MSRTKKSRKPGSAPTAKPKLSKIELASIEKRQRKKTGKKPGNRQQEAKLVKKSDKATSENKDPRIGSKKPIQLGGSIEPTKNKPVKVEKTIQSPIAAIRVVDAEEINLAQELVNIETDERLQSILEKQEEGIILTEQEVDYYNELMERHQQLTEELAENEEPEEPNSNTTDSAEDLWDKLDNSSIQDDFDKF